MSWIKRASEDEELRPAAALAVLVMQNEGVDFGQSVIDLVAPLPHIPPDTAELQLRDMANKELTKIPVTLSYQREWPRKHGDPIAKFGIDFGDLGGFWFELISDLGYPPRMYRLCDNCKEVFKPKRSTGVYCSDACRYAARDK